MLQQSKVSNLMEVVKTLISDYSSRSTIQGINYVANGKLTTIERLWWSIIVVISVLCSGSLVLDVLKRFDRSPVLISFEDEETVISKIPFPAVTICPQLVSKYVEAMYHTLRVKNKSLYTLDQASIDQVVAVAQLCDPALFSTIDPLNKTNCDKCVQALKTQMGTMDLVLRRCNIAYQQRCADLFQEVVTEDGLCYTFNGLDVYKNSTYDENNVAWTLEDGFDKSAEQPNIYPQPGSRFPLIVSIMVYKVMNSVLCKGPTDGFKVYLHMPNEVPQISKHYYLVPIKRTVKLAISPKMITTVPDLRELAVEKRLCYFNNERSLRFFRYYTQNNCESDCVANLTLSHCGCLRFNIPKIQGVKTCGISDINCYQSVVEKEVEQSISKSTVCNCLPACTEITFDTEITKNRRTDGVLDRPEYTMFNFADFSIVFRNSQFVALKRSRKFGSTELLANCGGLLGLFLGFSMLSFLELVYFCTIRLFCNLREYVLNKVSDY